MDNVTRPLCHELALSPEAIDLTTSCSMGIERKKYNNNDLQMPIIEMGR